MATAQPVHKTQAGSGTRGKLQTSMAQSSSAKLKLKLDVHPQSSCVSTKGKPLINVLLSSSSHLTGVQTTQHSDCFHMYPCAICGATYVYRIKDYIRATGEPGSHAPRRMSKAEQILLGPCPCSSQEDSKSRKPKKAPLERLEATNLEKLWVYRRAKDMLPYVSENPAPFMSFVNSVDLVSRESTRLDEAHRTITRVPHLPCARFTTHMHIFKQQAEPWHLQGDGEDDPEARERAERAAERARAEERARQLLDQHREEEQRRKDRVAAAAAARAKALQETAAAERELRARNSRARHWNTPEESIENLGTPASKDGRAGRKGRSTQNSLQKPSKKGLK